MPIPNQPVTILGAIKHEDLVKTTRWNSKRPSEWLTLNMAWFVGARQAVLMLSETADVLVFSHTTIFRVCCGQRRMTRLIQAVRNSIVTQISQGKQYL